MEASAAAEEAVGVVVVAEGAEGDDVWGMRMREGFEVCEDDDEASASAARNGAWLRPFPEAPEAVGEDVADAVLERLGPRDLASLAAVSRAWRVRCGEDVLWRRLYEARWGADYASSGEDSDDGAKENVEGPPAPEAAAGVSAGGESAMAGGARRARDRHASYKALYAARHRHERLGGEVDGILREGNYVFAFESGEVRLPLGHLTHPLVPDREARWTPDPAPAENVLDNLLGLLGDVHASAAEVHAQEQEQERLRRQSIGLPSAPQFAWHPLGVSRPDQAPPAKQWRRPLTTKLSGDAAN